MARCTGWYIICVPLDVDADTDSDVDTVTDTESVAPTLHSKSNKRKRGDISDFDSDAASDPGSDSDFLPKVAPKKNKKTGKAGSRRRGQGRDGQSIESASDPAPVAQVCGTLASLGAIRTDK